MPEEFLEACLKDRAAQAEALIGLKLSPAWFEEKEIMAMRLDDWRSDPDYAPWSLRAIGLRSTGEMVGHIGFHSRPDDEYLRPFAPDGIEFGYTVFPEHRRQGYAREAIQGLIKWAAEEHGVRHFVVSISHANVASATLAARLGFMKVGEHMDAVDGLEEVRVLAGEPLMRLLSET